MTTSTPYYDALTTIHEQKQARLCRYLASAFPKVGPHYAEEAVADAFCDAVARPVGFIRAWNHGGNVALFRLLRCAAWRHLRNGIRKHSYHCEFYVGAAIDGTAHGGDDLDGATHSAMGCDDGVSASVSACKANDMVAGEISRSVTPHQVAVQRELFGRIQALIPQAVEHFGHGRSDALKAALQARLAGDMDSDTEAAREYGVPREYLNRAKQWIARQVLDA